MDTLKQAEDKGIVIGLKDVDGVVARQDIDVLLKGEPDTFNLYLLALKELKEDPKWNHPMSYFQIAGIHGLPNSLWDKVDGKNVISVRNNDSSGYCAHGTPTFPTWHRPYLAMLEQTIYKKMLEISENYSNAQRRADYQKAVKKFRLPYLDYHRPRNYNATFPGVKHPRDGTTFYPYDFGVPQILTLKNIMVRTYPDDTPKQIDNPLYQFRFPSGAISETEWSASQINPDQEMKNDTMRYPHNLMSRFDPITAMNGAVNEQREDCTRMSLLMMEDGPYNGYESFATNGVSAKFPLDGRDASGSLESVHGAYHVYLGGLGHMGSVPTAAFDPIFWLHHCQIDRWFAIWQASHPKSWFADEDLAGQVLLPFRHAPQASDKPEFWNSNQSRDTKAFGYTYLDISGIENDPVEVRKRYKNRYSWSRRLTPKGAIGKPPLEMEPLDLSETQFFKGIKEFKPLDPAGRSAAKPVVLAAVEPPFAALSVQDQAVLKAAPEMKAAPEVQAAPEVKAAPDVKAAPELKATPEFSTKPSAQFNEEKVSREWFVDDVVKRLALNNSFTIFFFIGQIDVEPVDYAMAPSFAGADHIFTSPVEVCDNCGLQSQQAQRVSSTTPITSMLFDYVEIGELESMRPEHVQPFLIKNLKWRVRTMDGERYNPRNLENFELSVSCKVSPLPGEHGEVVYETYPQIIAEIIRNSA